MRTTKKKRERKKKNKKNRRAATIRRTAIVNDQWLAAHFRGKRSSPMRYQPHAPDDDRLGPLVVVRVELGIHVCQLTSPVPKGCCVITPLGAGA